jgi:16S rRNA (guanine966-N2)-methyltransferase
MRIIAGKLGGRNFDSPGGHRTHPMSDKIRGALFNILGDITGLSILDAFAGTGAVAFEAISRGASRAVVVDSDKRAQRVLAQNIETLGLHEQVTLFRGFSSAWSNRHNEEEFDIVVCDPPYDSLDFKLLDRMARHTTDKGIFILSWPGKFEIPKITGMDQITGKSYGDAQLAFYKKTHK